MAKESNIVTLTFFQELRLDLRGMLHKDRRRPITVGVLTLIGMLVQVISWGSVYSDILTQEL